MSAGHEAAFCSPELARRLKSRLTLLALVALVTLTISCSSISSLPTQTSQTTSSVTVHVSPSEAQISSSSTAQFTATVSGTTNVAVLWSATGGTISSTGLFTPSRTAASGAITATSVANPKVSASATVTLAKAATLSIVQPSLPGAQVAAPYSAALQATGGTQPYKWAMASGSLPQGLVLASSGAISGTATQPGSFSFGVKVTDSGSQTTQQSMSLQVSKGSVTNYTGFDGPAELPRSYMQTALANTPAPGSVIPVSAGGDLQAVLDRAACGDTIQLQAGAVFTGIFTLPALRCDDKHWVIIRTSTPDSALPPEGTRMTPCYAGVASLPGRPTYPCSNPRKLLATIQLNQSGMLSGPVQFLVGANHYRFVGLEITKAVGVSGTVDLIGMQDGRLGGADHIIVDRCWVHGTAQDETRRGFALRSISLAGIVDSYFSDFHCTAVTGTCVDSNAVGGGSGDFPQVTWSIVNNFLEAAGEGILLGGGPATITPTDIEIRRNHFFKPLIWLKGTPGFVGGKGGNPFVVKNHVEFKNGQRVLLEGNIFENNWGGFSQHGHSIVLTPRNNYDGQIGVNNCWTCKVADITIRYSAITHVGAGFDLSNVLTKGEPAAPGGRYSIHDVTVDDVEKAALNGGGGLFLIMSHWPNSALSNIQITHITAFPDPDGRILAIASPASGPPMTGFVFTNNVVTVPGLPVYGADGGSLNCDTVSSPIVALGACFPGYKFTQNVLIAAPAKYSSEWPAGNSFAPSIAATAFVNYNNAEQGNYALSPQSAYRAKSGPDPGADIIAINTATAGVQ